MSMQTRNIIAHIAFLLYLIFLMVLTGVSRYQLRIKNQQIKSLIELRQTETHVWIMDKSCSEQLLNSNDGVLRIKTK